MEQNDKELRLQVANAAKNLGTIDGHIDELQKKRRVDEQLVRRALSAFTGVPEDDIQLGSWDCKKSPTGECYYDMRRPGMQDDECLVCGGPDERR